MSKPVILATLVGLLALGVRLPGLGSFMTADEENWMLRSQGFYHNLFLNHDPGGTFMTTHPGATAMWLIGAGMLFQDGRWGATLPIAIATAILTSLATWLLIKLFGLWPAAAAGFLLAVEPYLVGMSQIAHLDMLLALLMLSSVLAFLIIQKSKLKSQNFNLKLQTICGVFAGLALATKLLPALWLFIFFGLFLLWRYRLRVSNIVQQLGFIFGVAMLTFYAAWPALWFTADLGRSFEKDVPYVIQDAHVAIEDSSEQIAPAGFYIRTVLGRATPFVLILAAGSAVLIFLPLRRGGWSRLGETEGSQVRWLFLYALGFLLLITLAAKKADRYALPALVMLPVITGISLPKLKWVMGIAGVLLLAQIFIWVPYAIVYNSPVFNVRPLSQQGWGEGLDAAAAWLNARPLAEELYVASWYPSVMRTYFHGKTFSLSSRDDSRVSYVVLYRNMMGRAPDTIASDVLDEYRNKRPEYVVTLAGVPYVWIYATDSTELYTQHVGEVRSEVTVGQIMSVTQNAWHAIEIGMANFSNRANTQDVILHVRESLEAKEDLRTVRVNAREIHDGVFHRFEFEPIPDSADKTYYVFLESPTSRPGDAVTVRFANQDVLPGEMVKNGEVLPGRDVAWRIPY